MKTVPLVLVHGFMGGSAQWESQYKAFDGTCQIITPDLPGFGKNAHLSAPDRIEEFARYVLDALEAQGVERSFLLGHSMGGMIVQQMYALAPHRVERLILYGTASTGNLPGRFETFETSRERVKSDGVSAAARRISATWFLKGEESRGFEDCAKIAEQASFQAVIAGLNAMEEWSLTENLNNISCPTGIIWGEGDRTYQWQQIEILWRSIPNVSLAVLPGCAHAAHLEKPELFNAILRELLFN